MKTKYFHNNTENIICIVYYVDIYTDGFEKALMDKTTGMLAGTPDCT